MTPWFGYNSDSGKQTTLSPVSIVAHLLHPTGYYVYNRDEIRWHFSSANYSTGPRTEIPTGAETTAWALLSVGYLVPFVQHSHHLVPALSLQTNIQPIRNSKRGSSLPCITRSSESKLLENPSNISNEVRSSIKFIFWSSLEFPPAFRPQTIEVVMGTIKFHFQVRSMY